MNSQTAYLDIDGYRFAVLEHGSGTPVLFVHGSVSDYRTWQPQLETFGRRYRAIAYSRRYHWPNAPIETGADYAMNRHVDDLAAIIETLDVAPIRLVGHSYGAYLCLLLAIRYPYLVHSMVLAEPPAVPLFVSNPPKPEELLKLFATRPRVAMSVIKFGAGGLAPATKAFYAGRYDDGVRIFGRTVLGTEPFENLTKERREQLQANVIPAEFLGSGFAPLHDDQVRGVDKPVLFLTGARSPALFHHLCDRLIELLPGSRQLDIPDASHILHEDNTSAFNRAVKVFLTEVENVPTGLPTESNQPGDRTS